MGTWGAASGVPEEALKFPFYRSRVSQSVSHLSLSQRFLSPTTRSRRTQHGSEVAQTHSLTHSLAKKKTDSLTQSLTKKKTHARTRSRTNERSNFFRWPTHIASLEKARSISSGCICHSAPRLPVCVCVLEQGALGNRRIYLVHFCIFFVLVCACVRAAVTCHPFSPSESTLLRG